MQKIKSTLRKFDILNNSSHIQWQKPTFSNLYLTAQYSWCRECTSIRNSRVKLVLLVKIVLFCFMVFNATFNNISVISWLSVLIMEETGENHRNVVNPTTTWSRPRVPPSPNKCNMRLYRLQWTVKLTNITL
jgi:hypothetical protein